MTSLTLVTTVLSCQRSAFSIIFFHLYLLNTFICICYLLSVVLKYSQRDLSMMGPDYISFLWTQQLEAWYFLIKQIYCTKYWISIADKQKVIWMYKAFLNLSQSILNQLVIKSSLFLQLNPTLQGETFSKLGSPLTKFRWRMNLTT